MLSTGREQQGWEWLLTVGLLVGIAANEWGRSSQ